MIVIKVDGLPYLCKTDEVGELCVCAGYTGSNYWGLQGVTSNTHVFNMLLFFLCKSSLTNGWISSRLSLSYSYLSVITSCVV
jgi:hypothetical protein